MKTLLGTELNFTAQQEALNWFVHRMTAENIRRFPEYAQSQFEGGYRLPIITDKEWLACTEFVVRKDGKLSRAHHHCYCKQGLPIKASPATH